MTEILVTGGAGYIGSHACKALAQAGYTPVVFDSLVYGHEWAVQWGPFEQGDLSDRARLDELFTTYDFAAVIHFAAYAYVGESVTDPAKYYRNNVAGTLNLLEAMIAHDVKQIVFSSTCATYGEPESIPITESHPQRPINPYGAS
ncbi:MAG: UDP-glucose 4-epimerase GalE, partial [Zetaproteobacteria bacterium CG_4_10_14_3_um_filter_54_28]